MNMMYKRILLVLVLASATSFSFAQNLKGKKLLKQANALVEKGDARAAISLLTQNFSAEDKMVGNISLQLTSLLIDAKLLDSANYYLAYAEKEESSKLADQVQTRKTQINNAKEQFKIATLLAWKAFDKEDYLTATEQFTKALTIDVGNYEPYLGNSEILFVGGQHEEAIKGFKKSLTKFISTPKEKAHIYEHLAEAYLLKRNTLQTIKACDAGLEIAPENSGLLFYKAKAFYFQRQFLEAEDLFTQFIRFNPEDAEAWYMRGACFYNLKDFDQAVSSFSSSIKFDSINDAFNLRGRSYYNGKDYTNALKDFQFLSAQFKGNFYAINAMGLSYFGNNQFDSAVVKFEEAVKLSSTFSYKFNLVNAYLKNGQNDKAETLCLEMAEENRGSERVNILLCKALINQKKYSEAEAWLAGSQKINPFVSEYFEIGEELFKLTGNTAASKDFKSRGSSMELNRINMDLMF